MISRKKARKLLKAALRSGIYEQGDGAPHRVGVGYCCLGVACSLAQANGLKLKTSLEGEGGEYVAFDGYPFLLPPSVVDPYGFRSEDGSILGSEMEIGGGLYHSLAHANDAGETFAAIADAIDRYEDKLFAPDSECPRRSAVCNA